MTIFKSFLLGSVFLLSLSVVAMADAEEVPHAEKPEIVKEEAVVAAPATVPAPVQEEAKVVPEPAPVEEVRPTTTSVCGSAGLLEKGSAPLSYFYPEGEAVKGDEAGVVGLKTSGTLSYDGQIYALERILFPKNLLKSGEGVEFPLDVRFDHVAKDGSRAVLVIPVKQGAANLSFEKMLRAGETFLIDPSLLLPTNKEYGSAGDCMAGNVKISRIVMTTPIEVSAAQLERFSKSF